MIFVTVGTQMHFDRLIEAVDDWAGTANTEEVFAQTGPSLYVAKHIRTKPFITPQEFREFAHQARVIIGHAGMGSILTTLEFGKRIIVMPRRSDLGEHRNDHQIATARYFAGQGRILVALDRQQLFDRLAQLSGSDAVEPIGPTASPVLIATIRQFIASRNIEPALQRRMPQPATLG
jgi:UDP-N-acetylglucosamine transferase subunit ALG13